MSTLKSLSFVFRNKPNYAVPPGAGSSGGARGAPATEE